MPPTKGQKARKQRMQARAKRMRDPKTPAAQVGSDAAYPDEEEEEGVDEGAMESSSDVPNETEEKGLGRPLPDVLPTWRTGEEDARENTRAADMGADQSRREVSKHMRDAAKPLRGEAEMAQSDRRNPGKLVKPSARAKPATMKRLGPSNRTRKSAYDLGGSPEKPLQLAKPTVDVTALSPLRKERKARQAAAQPHASPRRSGRAQAQQKDEAEPTLLNITIQSAREHVALYPDEDDAMYRDRFPDAVVQRYAETELDAEGGAGEADNLVAVRRDNQVQMQWMADLEQSAEKPKPKRGRPPKSSNAGVSEGHDRPDTATWLSAKDTPKDKAAGKTTPRPEQRSSARAQRKFDELKQQHAAGGSALLEKQPDERLQELPDRRLTATSLGKQASTVQMGLRRSSLVKQSLVGSNQQKDAQGITASAANEEIADDRIGSDLEEDGHGGAGEEHLPDKPVFPRISEVRFSNSTSDARVAEDAEDAEDAENRTVEAQTTQQRKKRIASSQTARANTGAKRRRRADAEDEGYQDEEEQEGSEERRETNRRRLWGQWLPLKRIYSHLRLVGCNTENGEVLEQNLPDLEDDDVNATVELCIEVQKRYQRLANSEVEDSEPAGILEEIGRRVDGLQGRNEDFPTDFDDKTKITNIYSHLIPALIKLVRQAVMCYEILDKDETPAGQISMSHLQIVLNIIHMTREVEAAAGNKHLYKARPDTQDAVVRPVHNGIAVPLRPIALAFLKILQHHRADVQATQRRQQEAQDRALKLEQEERRSRQAAELNRIRQKWEQLHRERMAAEGGIMRPAKMAHLRMPDPNRDVDGDGRAFDRVSVFHARVGPPPGLLDRAKELVWTEGELRALMDGLRMYAGPMVYERTFRAWCPRGRMLNKYNVTEIVAAAEMMRMSFEKEMGDEVEEWVNQIPIWSKSHAGGEENEGGLVDVDEDGGDDMAGTAGPS